MTQDYKHPIAPPEEVAEQWLAQPEYVSQSTIDPWAHRSEGMRCKSCMWFAPKVSGEFVHLGRCRRHAPTTNGYPAVFVNDWCGDHKINEAWFASNPS